MVEVSKSTKPAPIEAKEKVLLIEDGNFVEELGYQLAKAGIETETEPIVRENLLEIMEERNLRIALIHPRHIGEESAIIAAHQAGKTIVIGRRRTVFMEEADPLLIELQHLKEAGVNMIRRDADYLNNAINTLVKLSQKEEVDWGKLDHF